MFFNIFSVKSYKVYIEVHFKFLYLFLYFSKKTEHYFHHLHFKHMTADLFGNVKIWKHKRFFLI